MALAQLMVAPNGARLGKSDHPNLPVTTPEICQTAAECFAAGATALHLHIRDDQGRHLLDAGKYRETIAELARTVPDMAIQITSEAAGIYGPEHQRNMVLDAKAGSVSVSVREMAVESDTSITRRFYQDCIAGKIEVQHIIYAPQELDILASAIPKKHFNANSLQLLFVLGRYGKGGASGPDALLPFLAKLKAAKITPDWAVCAFGQQETNCLIHAHKLAGKMRVGFENSRLNQNGTTAGSNAERVSEIISLVGPVGLEPTTKAL